MRVRELCNIVSCNPATGELRWLPREACDRYDKMFNTKYAGKLAGTSVNVDGYNVLHIKNEWLLVHRVVWAMAHGRWPRKDLDHINGDRTDNRLANLREATRLQNQANYRTPTTNKSGYKGVSWCTRSKRWRAYISINSVTRHLGMFTDKRDAIAARRAAAIKYHKGFYRE